MAPSNLYWFDLQSWSLRPVPTKRWEFPLIKGSSLQSKYKRWSSHSSLSESTKRRLSSHSKCWHSTLTNKFPNQTILNNGFFRMKILSALKPFEYKTRKHLRKEMNTQIQEYWYEKKSRRCIDSKIAEYVYCSPLFLSPTAAACFLKWWKSSWPLQAAGTAGTVLSDRFGICKGHLSAFDWFTLVLFPFENAFLSLAFVLASYLMCNCPFLT